MLKNTIRFLTAVIIFVSLPLFEPAKANSQNIQYLFPIPGSKYNPPGTTIAIRFGEEILESKINNKFISVSGQISGYHPGEIILAADHKTLIFKPDRLFYLGEQVNVEISPGIESKTGKKYSGSSYVFSISNTNPSSPEIASLKGNRFSSEFTPPSVQDGKKPIDASLYVTAPTDLPQIHIETSAGDVDTGYIFATNFIPNAFLGDPNPGSYLLILDNNGEPVYYQQNPETEFATDFKVLSNGLLAYWQNWSYHLLDNSYTEVREIKPGNGYFSVDVHDLILLPNGNYMFLIYADEIKDMSVIVTGGNPNAVVVEAVIQEIDSNDNVVFQWNSLDHLDVTESNQDLTADYIDYIHSNAIELDNDGNILLSNRHLDNIVKINHDNGEVLWRLGGTENDFAFSNPLGIEGGENFYMQHDIRRLANGNISLFDNHNNHQPLISRALEYSLDELNKTAELVWGYQNTPDLFSGFMGNVQYLPNGNIMIGWGGSSNPNFTEIKPDGTKELELGFDTPYVNYRTFRYPWQGYPNWAPKLILQSSEGSINLYFSWNGATEISSYEIYGGNPGQTYTLINEIPKSGFESTVNLFGDQTNYCYYKVMPINMDDQSTQFSNIVYNASACDLIFLPMIANSN